MVNYITNTYTSGWLNGDIRGAWLADGTAGAISGADLLAASGVDGSFTGATPAGWSAGSGWSFSGSDASHSGDTGTYLTSASIGLVPGKTYIFTADVTGYIIIAGGTAVANVTLNTGTQARTVFTAGANNFLWIWSIGTATLDNISVKLADLDRSVKANPLTVNGTLTKSPVATGSQLMAYSGFSASNYLEQPYSSNLDFGTGDFCVMGWAKANATAYGALFSLLNKNVDSQSATGVLLVKVSSTNNVYLVAHNTSIGFSANRTIADWSHIVATRVGGVLYLYLNGDLIVSENTPEAITNKELRFGCGLDTIAPNEFFTGSLALWRISATAPSADQIKHIYETERKLFEPGAQCLLPEAAVTAMDYDDATDLLHVTSAGYHTAWKDLVRVSSEASSTGTLASVAASGGIVSLGGSAGADLYIPAKSLRDELARQDVATAALGSVPVFLDFTATDGQTAFVATQGYKILALYKNGTLMRESTTGVYWTRSTDGFQETATLSVGATVGDWVSLMLVRQQ